MHENNRTAVRVISLASALDRRMAFEEAAKNTKIEWSFFDAHKVLCLPLQYDENTALRNTGVKLTQAELGCYSSHYSLWKWFLESDYSQIIIFEDDVIIDWPFIEKLKITNFSELEINYLRLFTKIPARWRYLKTPFLDKYHHLIQITNFALGTQAYMLTREAAQKLINYTTEVVCPIDIYLDRYWLHGVKNLALYPYHVFEKFQPSSIGESRFQTYKLSFKNKAYFKYYKLRDRIYILWNQWKISK